MIFTASGSDLISSFRDNTVAPNPNRKVTFSTLDNKKDDGEWDKDIRTISDLIRFKHYKSVLWGIEKYQLDPIQFYKFINAQDEHGFTFLTTAILYGNRPIAKHLLTNGANINNQNSQGLTSLHILVAQNRITSLNKIKGIKFLLDNGADPDIRDNNGLTPIFYAVYSGDPNVTEFLLLSDHRINPNSEDYDGNTPIFCALTLNYTNMAEYLLNNGANPNHKNKYLMSPLAFLAFENKIDEIELLLHYNVVIDSYDKFGGTPILNAVLNRNYDAAKILLNHGADINHKDIYGMTPLHYAYVLGDSNMIEFLLENYADCSIKDIYGNAPKCYKEP